MVTELLGPTLGDLMVMCGNKFSLKTTLLIGLQIVRYKFILVGQTLINA